MKKMFRVLLAIVIFTTLVGSIYEWITTPKLAEIREIALGSDRTLLAADHTVLQTIRTDFSKRRLAWYPLKNFASTIQESVINVEDHRFRYHFGIDFISLGRAARANFSGQHRQGASTLTMQLSDLIQIDNLKHNRNIQKGSILHKLHQLVRALFIEMRWSKDEILEAYLNLIRLRGELQGIPAVSYGYLNKHPLALDSSESYVIATMISSPNQNEDLLQKRACVAYRKYFAADDSCAGIKSATENFFSHAPVMPDSPGVAPHLARRLFKEFPKDSIVATTIDSNLQKEVLSILQKNIYRLQSSNVGDTAAIVIDNKTGEVLAYVGTVPTSESPYVDGVMAYRQAGSSLKPFLYTKAIESKVITAASILTDEPTAISWGGDVYRPTNYDKHFSGPVSAREALGSSLNVPAVKIVTIIGLHQAYKVLQDVGLSNLREPDFYGVSLALGAVEVRLDELANAYRMLANGGKWTPYKFTASEDKISSRQIFSPESAFITSTILSDPNARSIGFGWESPLETPFWTAVKTGTSKDYRDNWCVGFSERYTVGVWAGNFNAEAMEKVSGVSGVGPAWFEIMSYLHRDTKSLPPSQPDNVIEKDIRYSWTTNLHKEYFIKGTEPTTNVIEPVLEKAIQFVFPAQNSVLVKDPHLDPKNIALYIRFKGSVPEKSLLQLDGKSIGEAKSPFKIPNPPSGEHDLAIVDLDGRTLTKIHFSVKGAN